MVKKLDQFNMVISGVGGQGLITLLQIVAEASLSEGYDIRTSELHGLSQRGGSVEVHIRFGQEIYSPMVSAGQADLILGLEMQEGLMAVNFAGPKTKLLINKYIIPLPPQKNLVEEDKSSSSAAELSQSEGEESKLSSSPFAIARESEGGKERKALFDFAAARVSQKKLFSQLKKIGQDVFLVPANEICQKELATNVVAGIYLISLAAFKKLIPIKPESILKAMRKIIPEKYLELNLKAFNLASKK